MILPTPSSMCGRILHAMLDGKPRTKNEIAFAIGEHQTKEITARVRELRSLGFIIPHRETERRNDETVYVYRLLVSPNEALKIRARHAIHGHDGLTVYELAGKLGIDSIRAALALKWLEQRGYVAIAGSRSCEVTGMPEWVYRAAECVREVAA